MLKSREKVQNSLNDAIAWFLNQSRDRSYGTVTLRAVLHDGKVSHFERSVTDRVYSRNDNGGDAKGEF